MEEQRTRRQGIYISKQKRGGIDLSSDEEYESNQIEIKDRDQDKRDQEKRDQEQDARERTKYFLEELERKEKESTRRAIDIVQERKYQKELQKSVQREKVKFSFLDEQPDESRLSVAPLSQRKLYDFEYRAIEKSAFGNYLFLKFLKNVKKVKNTCFIIPDFDLSLDAIRLFFEFQKMGIILPKPSLSNWKLAEPVFQNTKLFQTYKNTLRLVEENFEDFHKYLKFSERGPRLNKSIKIDEKFNNRKVPIYDKFIFTLFLKLMNSQIPMIDLNDSTPIFTFYPEEQLEKCLKGNKRYIIFFFTLIFDEDAHANMIVIDTKDKMVERYEPHGAQVNFYEHKVVDKILSGYFKKFGLDYLGPEDFCKEGIQSIFEAETGETYNFEGFCQTWSFIYAYFKTIYGQKKDRKTFTEDLKGLVLKMAKRYYELLYKMEKFPEMQTEDYDFVIEFLYEYIPELVKAGNEEIEKINQILGTDLVLEGRTVHTRI